VPETLNGESNFWWKILARIRVDAEFQDEIGIYPVCRIFGIDTQLSTCQDDGLGRVDQILVSVRGNAPCQRIEPDPYSL
jgi:hypothetical protein